MMNNKAIHLFFLFFTFFWFQTSSNRFQSGVDRYGNAMFTDHFYLVMQWQRGIAGEFRIHGLWPGDSQKLTSPPLFCDPGDTLRWADIQSLVTNLDTYWPDLVHNPPNNFDFWNKEWLKHGTCSGLSQAQYFDLALGLAMPLNLNRLLHSANVYSRSSYPPYRFINPLVVAFGVIPNMVCNGYQELREIRFNLTNDYPRNILLQNVDTSLIQWGCNNAPSVYFP